MYKKQLLNINEYLDSMELLIDSSKYVTALLITQGTFDLLKVLYAKLQPETEKKKHLQGNTKIKAIQLMYNKEKIKSIETSIKNLHNHLSKTNKVSSEQLKKITLLSEEIHNFYDNTNMIIKQLTPPFNFSLAIKKGFAFLRQIYKIIASNGLYRKTSIAVLVLLVSFFTGNMLVNFITALPSYKFYPATLSDKVYTSGWYTTDCQTGYRWSYRKEATITIPGQAVASDQELKVFVEESILAPLNIKTQRIALYINEQQVPGLTISGKGIYSSRIPQNIISTKNLNIKFLFTDSTSAATIFGGNELSQLGISLKGIALDKINSAPYYKVGDTIFFGTKGNAEKYLTCGWYSAGKNVHYTTNGSSELTLKTKSSKRELIGKITLESLPLDPSEITEQTVNIFVNNNLVHTQIISGAQAITFKIPATLITSKILRLKIESPQTIKIPYRIGAWEGTQAVALAIKSIRIIEKKNFLFF